MLRNNRYKNGFPFGNPCPTWSRVIFFFVVLALHVSCNKQKEPEKSIDKGRAVARVFQKEVFSTEIPTFSGPDSAKLVKAFLDKLTQESALLQKAKESGFLDLEEIEEKTKQFRHSLMILYYQQEYVKKHLDSTITPALIKNYYEQNKASFMLREDIYRGYIIKIATNTPKLDRLKAAMSSDKPMDYQEVKNYCLRYASSFNINPDDWAVFPSHLRDHGHFRMDNVRSYIQNRQVLSFEKDENLYLVRFFDYKSAKQESPMTYAEQQIKHIILNKRRMQLLGKLHEEVLSEAVNNHQQEIY